MPTLQSQTRVQYPQSARDFAFTDEHVEELFAIARKRKADQERWDLAQGEMEKEIAEDALAPARGIVNGLHLSVTLWSFIALVFLLVR